MCIYVYIYIRVPVAAVRHASASGKPQKRHKRAASFRIDCPRGAQEEAIEVRDGRLLVDKPRALAEGYKLRHAHRIGVLFGRAGC